MNMFRHLRLFSSLQGFRWSWLPQDMMAAIMLLAIAIPGQIATAKLAGMPPQTGLYAFLAGTLAFAVFGANRYISVAADSTIAPIFASVVIVLAGTNTVHYVGLVTLLSILTGAVLIIVGLSRAGWIADLLSIPVTAGFLAGIAVHIVIGQVPDMLGFAVSDGHLFYRFVEIVWKIPETNIFSLLISSFMLVSIFSFARFSRKFPASLLGLCLVSLTAWIFGLGEMHGVAMLGRLPARLPEFVLPSVSLNDAARLFPLALTIALICMVQTAAVVRSYPSNRDQQEDISQDFTAVGSGNVLAGFTGAFPVNASPPSTAVIASSGGRSQLCGLFAALMIVGLILFSGPLFSYVPMAALCSVLVVVATRIFRLREMIDIARHGGIEFVLVIASILLVVMLPIEIGVMLSVILSLIYNVYTVARPVCAELVRLRGTTIWWPRDAHSSDREERVEGVVAFAPSAPVNFTNIGYIRKELLRVIEHRGPEKLRFVVIDASGVAALDYTGARILGDTVGLLRMRGMEVALARLSSPRAEENAVSTGFVALVGEEKVFHSVDDAVRDFLQRRG